MKKCIRGILFPLMKSENSQQNDCESRDEAVWLCTKAEVDLCKAEEMRNQKLQNSVRLPKHACKPGENSLNPACVLIVMNGYTVFCELRNVSDETPR